MVHFRWFCLMRSIAFIPLQERRCGSGRASTRKQRGIQTLCCLLTLAEVCNRSTVAEGNKSYAGVIIGLEGTCRVERKCYLFIWLRKFEVSNDWSPDQLCCLIPHPWNKSDNRHWAGDCQGWLSIAYFTPEVLRTGWNHTMACRASVTLTIYQFPLAFGCAYTPILSS